MARSVYPDFTEPPRYKEVLLIYGIGGLIGFAITFAIAWFAPSGGLVLLAAPVIYFLFGRDYTRKRTLRLLFELFITFAAVFSAAALK